MESDNIVGGVLAHYDTRNKRVPDRWIYQDTSGGSKVVVDHHLECIDSKLSSTNLCVKDDNGEL